ncbi:MAG TPA: adenylate/guanylate cyclase domain-containing protein [Nannocystis sp.]
MPIVEFERERCIQADDPDRTLLEIALAAGIPHASACGGQGRCSTCRVLVLDHPEHLTPATEVEQRLARVKGFEPNIRAACQTRVLGDVRVRRLVLDDEDARLASAGTAQSLGRERQLAVLFSDIRDFTSFTERHLPYDVVHILSRYFLHMGEQVLLHGGYIDKYMGDGMMALFGLERVSPAEACGDAVRAGLDMLAALTDFNVYLRRQFDLEFQIGIGIHYGSVIVGEIGHPQKAPFTAIGDTVNTAARVESATARLGAQLLVTEAVRAHAGDIACYRPAGRVPLRGKQGEHELYAVTAGDK